MTLSSNALADYAAGQAAIKRQAFETAFRELLPEAERGNVQAQVLVANMYRRGYGVQRDHQQAVKWYRRAAEQGHGAAQYNLAVHYREGIGVDRDDELATDLFRKSALNGFAPGQINLGLRYAQGRTLAKDLVLGFAWLTKAAGQGNVDAIRKRKKLAEQMTEAEIGQAKLLSYSLY